MRVFVDVGAHYGQTLDIALDPRWGFARIYSLEPSAACMPLLREFKDDRLVVQQVGLSSETRSASLYGAGLRGGSIHADKRQTEPSPGRIREESIELVRASDWLEHNVPAGADVYLKLNCEGSECDILLDLLDANLSHRIKSVYVDFDVRKVERLAHLQQVVEQRLVQAGVDYMTPEVLGCNGHDGVHEWLDRVGLSADVTLASRLHHSLRMYAPVSRRLRMAAAVVLPRAVYWWLGRRFGRVARLTKHAHL
jgi:FkbM family methyltransferase